MTENTLYHEDLATNLLINQYNLQENRKKVAFQSINFVGVTLLATRAYLFHHNSIHTTLRLPFHASVRQPDALVSLEYSLHLHMCPQDLIGNKNLLEPNVSQYNNCLI